MKSYDLTESITTKYLLALTCLASNQVNLLLFPTSEHAHSAKQRLYSSINNTENIVRHTKNTIEFDNNSKLFFREANVLAVKGMSLTKLAIHSDVDRDYLEHVIPSVRSAEDIIWFF